MVTDSYSASLFLYVNARAFPQLHYMLARHLFDYIHKENDFLKNSLKGEIDNTSEFAHEGIYKFTPKKISTRQ